MAGGLILGISFVSQSSGLREWLYIWDLGSKEPGAVRTAVEYLGEHGTSSALPGLLEVIRGSYCGLFVEIRVRGADGICRSVQEAPCACQKVMQAIVKVSRRSPAPCGKILSTALESPDAGVRRHVLYILGELGPAVKPMVPRILQLEKTGTLDENPDFIEEIVEKINGETKPSPEERRG